MPLAEAGEGATSFKFDRQRRILPGEVYMSKPDYNNVLFHKDKGRIVCKQYLKGYSFQIGKESGP